MVVEHNGCGELSPEQWHRYLTLQQEASEALFHALALRWRQLEEENAPLRTVLSGKICSMEEDFYDRLIQQELYGMGREFFEAAAHRVAVREISCRDWWRMVPSADSGNGGQGKTGGNHHPDTGEPGLPKNVKKIWRRKIKAVLDEKSPGQLKKNNSLLDQIGGKIGNKGLLLFKGWMGEGDTSDPFSPGLKQCPGGLLHR